MKILVLGVTGLIGSTIFKTLGLDQQLQVFGTTRRPNYNSLNVGLHYNEVIFDINFENSDCIFDLFEKCNPNIVINCVGITKHSTKISDPVTSIFINSILPHRLSKICTLMNIRLIHISSDCVFSGTAGSYTEESVTDAHDLYGRTKSLGEVIDQKNCVTLRTSTIGHEIETKYGLLEWFLSQKNECNGFSKAIFSGLTTLELANIIKKFVIPNLNIYGLYNIASEPISKYDLLCLISSIYRKDLNIVKNSEFKIDRSLNPNKFFKLTGYVAPKWKKMIHDMYEARSNV